jgi:hypothetical protein
VPKLRVCVRRRRARERANVTVRARARTVRGACAAHCAFACRCVCASVCARPADRPRMNLARVCARACVVVPALALGTGRQGHCQARARDSAPTTAHDQAGFHPGIIIIIASVHAKGPLVN